MKRDEEWHRENGAALAGCNRPHRFVCIQPRGENGSVARFRCKGCGGVVSEKVASWYGRGIVDGKRSVERRQADQDAETAAA